MTASCPVCGADPTRGADGFGVRRCSACGIEFRTPERVPIRHASISRRAALSGFEGLVLSAMGIGVVVGIAISLDGPARTSPPEQFPGPIELQPSILPPTPSFADQVYSPLAPVTLAYQRHVTQLDGRALFMTGVLTGDGQSTYTDLAVEVRCRDPSGNQLGAPRAVLACDRLGPDQTCAWMLEIAVAIGVTELEVVATGVREFGIEGPQLELVGDAVRLELADRTVRFEAPARITDAWIAVTALDHLHHVLGVTRTSLGTLEPGPQQAKVSVPEVATEQVARHEVVVGGGLSRLGLP